MAVRIPREAETTTESLADKVNKGLSQIQETAVTFFNKENADVCLFAALFSQHQLFLIIPF